MARDRHRAAWEDWAAVDPLWAVLSEPAGRHGGWDRDQFFATGVDLVDTVLTHSAGLGAPAKHELAVDFGCGVGRITRSLAPHFRRTVGLDVAQSMIDEARRADAERSGAERAEAVSSGLEFVRQEGDDLGPFATGSVDLLTCFLVLQHLPSRAGIEGYLREFVRVLAPGGIAVFQLPVHVPSAAPKSTLRDHLALRTRGGRLLRAIGVSPRVLYERFGWQPEMRMSGIPFDETVAVLESAGGRVLDVSDTSTDPGGVVSRIYFVGRGAAKS